MTSQQISLPHGRNWWRVPIISLALQVTSSGSRSIADYAIKHGGPTSVVAFFRGQLLELARWVAMHCQNLRGDGETFKDLTTRSAFLRAALIASELWLRRLFGPEGLKPLPDLDARFRQSLGAFRKNMEEGNEAAHPGFTVARGWLLFSRYVPKYLPGFADIFERSTSLVLRQYFICAFALTERTFSDHPPEKRIFATQYVPDDTRIGAMFEKFLLSLRQRPVLSFSGNRSIIFDPTFYLDNLTTSPLFHVKSAGVSMQTVSAAFGNAFEDYVADLLLQRFPSGNGMLYQRLRCQVEGTNTSGEVFKVDAVLNDVIAAVVFEIKANWIREDTILDKDPEVFLNEIRKKYGYVQDSEERAKGVAQLARSIGALMRREWSGPDQEYAQVVSVYPVLLVFDIRMAAPGIGRFLEKEFRNLLGSVPAGFFVHPLIILTISDLEHLVSGVESLSLQEVLRAYSSADPERVSSVHNFIATSPVP